MILTSENQQTEFELRLLGYQFLDTEHDEYDSNWLMVQVNARTPAGSWSSIDPCMLTWEAHWLLNWLADLASDSESDPEMSFLEPNLFFRLSGRCDRILDVQVCVSGELRPRNEISAASDEVQIGLELSLSALHECVTNFSRELASFPVRAGGTRRCRPYSDPKTNCVLCREAPRGSVTDQN